MNTLLVVEDEKLIRQGIVAMIRRSSVPVEEILECRNGEEAVEILRKQRVDVGQQIGGVVTETCCYCFKRLL